MHEQGEGGTAAWKTEHGVAAWLAESEDRERHRSEQRRLMADLLPFAEEDPFVFVDLGAGTGAAARAVLERYPRASALLAEYSSPMAEAGERALEPYGGRYRYVDFDLASGPWPEAIPDRVDAVISSMCLHHLPDPRKEQLCAEVHARLAPGGWFLDLDLVAGDDAAVEAAWRRVDARRSPHSAPLHHHTTAEQHDHDHAVFLRPLPRRLGFLREAGFEGVDVYWKRLDSVLIGGRRPD